MAKVKEPARPPYVHATGPTSFVTAATEHQHGWVKGEISTIDRIPHRDWSCPCGAFGFSVELILK